MCVLCKCVCCDISSSTHPHNIPDASEHLGSGGVGGDSQSRSALSSRGTKGTQIAYDESPFQLIFTRLVCMRLKSDPLPKGADPANKAGIIFNGIQ